MISRRMRIFLKLKAIEVCAPIVALAIILSGAVAAVAIVACIYWLFGPQGVVLSAAALLVVLAIVSGLGWLRDNWRKAGEIEKKERP